MKKPKSRRPIVTDVTNDSPKPLSPPAAMLAIHLVEKRGLIRVVDIASDEYESGFWVLDIEKAQALIGGDVYFHSSRSDPSFFGGRVLGVRVQPDGEFAGRIVFRLRSELGHKGVRTDRTGWRMEKKVVAVNSDACQ
jgi:hypothetical protein